MIALLGAVFIASLVGSLHCAGMCGGIVALCVGLDPSPRGRWRMHALYNGGRAVTYMALGGLSGAIGAAFDLGASAAGLQRAAALLAGAGMVLFGIGALLRARGVHLGCWKLPESIRGLFTRGLRAAGDRPPVVRAALIGLLTGLLPCGWLYAFVVTAAGTGHPLHGAAVMAAFWLGTVPVLLTMGIGLQGLSQRFRRHVPTATALGLIVVGVVAVTGRLRLPAYADADLGPVPTVVDPSSASDLVPPCCRDDD